MKKLLLTAAVLALLPGAAMAADTAPNNSASNGVCLRTYQIDHTKVEDGGKSIIFYMLGGKAWRNTLLSRCPGLKFYGFSYITRDGQICSNMQTIIVLHTNAVCMMGNFEPYTPPPKSAPDPH